MKKLSIAVFLGLMLVLSGCGPDAEPVDNKKEEPTAEKDEEAKEEKAPELDTSGPPTKLDITEKPEELAAAESFTIKGVTEPNAKVTLILDDKVMSTKEADNKGNFEFTSVAVSSGLQNYEVRAKADGQGDGMEIINIEVK